jgi:hypothetical protein
LIISKNCFIDLIDSGAKIREGMVLERTLMVVYMHVSKLPMPTFEGDAMMSVKI